MENFKQTDLEALVVEALKHGGKYCDLFFEDSLSCCTYNLVNNFSTLDEENCRHVADPELFNVLCAGYKTLEGRE